ncbi:hypothetical protein H5T51_06250 [Candidatus Bathyarchaeota archaeon]|nr:hypothetical protein [Candidatus Bathyarchaeota archaeon]
MTEEPGMLSKAAVAKLKVAFIAVLVLLAASVAAYVYLESLQPETITEVVKPAEFQLTDFTLYPTEVEVEEPLTVSVNVTNVGDLSGNYSVALFLDGEVFENRTVQLSGMESTIVEFTVSSAIEGNHTVRLGNFTGTFTVKAPTLPEYVKISNMVVKPYEVWVGEKVQITAKITNENESAVECTLRLTLNETLYKYIKLQLDGKESQDVAFEVTAEKEGIYSVRLGSARGAFRVVPEGMHTLSISSSPPGIEFTLNGEIYKTPYSALLKVGKTYTINMPKEFIVSRVQPTFQFRSWSDGTTDPIKTITLESYTSLMATYEILASCPAMHVWNGSEYVYITEVSDGTGYLGILDYFKEDGSMVFSYSVPWDYVKLERVKPQPKEGYYDVLFVQKADEIFYMDSVTLVVVDHPADVNVYSTKATYTYELEEQGVIYTVSKNLKTPVSAINDKGEDCLPLISKLDGVYTSGNEFHWDTLELNLGDLSGAEQIKLVVAGTIFYSPGQVQGEWAAQFADKPGERPFPPPYMEVKDASGNWVPVPESRQFPLCDVGTDIFVVNLTGLFITDDYSLRIHTFFDTRFDFIAVDTSPQLDIIIREVQPAYAELSQAFSTNSTSSGNFTRYGDVTALLLEPDDKFVIGRQGDQINVKFPANLPPVPDGMKRSYFIFVSCWFKVKGLPYLSFTVEPLPFHEMSCFPYPPTESYPYDAEHMAYLLTYNTRNMP